MSKIQIYARVRPTKNLFEGMRLSEKDGTIDISIGDLDNISKRPDSRYSRAPPSKHTFKFNHIFGQQVSQEEVFDHVAVHMIDSFLCGYNGTIFAYGQTSSGKTHTIEGSSRKFADRGLIPRAISMIFEEVERRCGLGQDVSVQVSYMEIYQDTGYDLLNPGTRPGALMVTLPKVHVTEGPGNEVRVRNLSLHLAASEKVALSLLFQGSTCRKVAETSMNQCSSRSHTIFTIYLTVKSQDKEIITRSKLNLVDLAGSERVAKTRADGRILREAKYINLSLHHLEHVIVTLQQLSRQISSPHRTSSNYKLKPRGSPSHSSHGSTRSFAESSEDSLHSVMTASGGGGHVPYRNSMLTMVLKDSLGGNCLTAMIATISGEESNIWESVSTCRFSQRVACISNTAKCNQELDDKVVIRKLKQRISELKAEILQLKNSEKQQDVKCGGEFESSDVTLPPNEQKHCHEILHQFFHGKIENPVHAGINSAAKFHECMQVMRKIVLHALDIQQNGTTLTQQHHQEQQQQQEQQQDHRERREVGQLTWEGTAGERAESHSHSERGREKDQGTSKHFPPEDMEDRAGSQEAAYSSAGNSPAVENYEAEMPPPPPAGPKRTPLFTKASTPRTGHPQETQTHIADGSSTSHLSRLSSGFCSMQDEGSALTLDSYADRNRPSPSLHTRRKSETREQRRQRKHSKRFSDQEAEEQSLYPDYQHMPGSNPPTIQAEQSLYNPNHQHGNPPPIQAWTGSVRSSYDRGSTASSVVSRGVATEAVQTLVQKQVELQQSKLEEQKLAQNVQYLKMKVSEENLANELSEVKEALAQQHLHVKMSEREGLDPLLLTSEKIARQQLRMKQSEIYQKLLGVRHQMKAAAGVHAEVEEELLLQSLTNTPQIKELASTLSAEANSHLQGHATSKRAKKELDKRQTMVEEQLEKIKVSQMEKHLELKEAATRRKIQALKHQLTRSQGREHCSQAQGREHSSQAQGRGQQATVNWPRKETKSELRSDRKRGKKSSRSPHSGRSKYPPLTESPFSTDDLYQFPVDQHLEFSIPNARQATHSRQVFPDPNSHSGVTHRTAGGATEAGLGFYRVDSTAQQTASVQSEVPQPASIRNKAPQPASVHNEVPQPASVRNKAPQPASVRNEVPQPASVRNKAPQPATATTQAVESDSLWDTSRSSGGDLTASVMNDKHYNSTVSGTSSSKTITSQTLPMRWKTRTRDFYSDDDTFRVTSSDGNFTPPSTSTANNSHTYEKTSPHSKDHMTRHQGRPSPNNHTNSSFDHMTSPPDHMTPPPDHMTPPTSHMTSPASSTPARQGKLTFPEEVKETEYMSAVQKQKVRVSRIRRCIVAATVIQRAWRHRKAWHSI